jgi:hypothetical protein
MNFALINCFFLNKVKIIIEAKMVQWKKVNEFVMLEFRDFILINLF